MTAKAAADRVSGIGLDAVALAELRSALSTLSDPVPRAGGVVVTESVVGSRRCLIVTPPDAAPGTILYVHGGAFCLFRADPYIPMAGHLAAATRTRVVLPDYDLPPEYPFPIPVLDVLAVHAGLREAGGPMVVAADSAGAAIALAALRLAQAAAVPMPALVALFSPWVDLTLSAPSVEGNRMLDTELDRASLAAYARAYARDVPLDHALVSPRSVEAPFPPLLVQAAEHEILLDDARRLVASARALGVEATLDVARGMQHNYQFWGPLRPAAVDAYGQVAARLDRLRNVEGPS